MSISRSASYVELEQQLTEEDRHVLQAAQRPVVLDDRQVSAVAARIELDLRLGAIFTRFQTLTLQTLGGDLATDRIISYGTRPNHSRSVRSL